MTIPKIENQILHMDCLAGLALLPDKSVDMILTDLPYGVTDCAWDKVLPLGQLWQSYKRRSRIDLCAALYHGADTKQPPHVPLLLVLEKELPHRLCPVQNAAHALH